LEGIGCGSLPPGGSAQSTNCPVPAPVWAGFFMLLPTGIQRTKIMKIFLVLNG
jgi:hypothetical protein